MAKQGSVLLSVMRRAVGCRLRTPVAVLQNLMLLVMRRAVGCRWQTTVAVLQNPTVTDGNLKGKNAIVSRKLLRMQKQNCVACDLISYINVT